MITSTSTPALAPRLAPPCGRPAHAPPGRQVG